MTGRIFCSVLILAIVSGILFLLKNYFRLRNRTGFLRQAVHDLKLLQKLSSDMSSHLEMNELLPAIMGAFVKAGKVKKGSIMLYDRKEGILRIRESLGLSPRAVENVKLKIGEGIAGRVAYTRKPVLVNDTTENRFYKEIFPDDALPKETILSLPLIFKGELLGVVNLDSKITGEQFIRNDERLMSIIASHAAVSINNARMYELAITDGLTGLYIKRYFLRHMHKEFEKAKRYGRALSLVFIDIDNFKDFNDTNRHQVGDQALIHISKLILQSTRAADLCARYGGDEFVVMMPETAGRKASVLAERLRKNIEETVFTHNRCDYGMTVTIGVAEYSDNMETFDDLINMADSRLYMAKEQGRNRVMGFN
ncbi:MAG: sensor domain-containing diguanylate cyclase [Elusimicrobia bacterium]|nr:sensor domain-containing diguanylate cyclase [Elusimicrobiota bacterium]